MSLTDFSLSSQFLLVISFFLCSTDQLQAVPFSA